MLEVSYLQLQKSNPVDQQCVAFSACKLYKAAGFYSHVLFTPKTLFLGRTILQHGSLVSFGLRDTCCSSSLEPVLAVKTPLTTVEAVPGGDALFTLDLTTTCSGTWYLNGKVLQESETYIIKRTLTTHTLIIKNVTKNDDGAEVKFVANNVDASTKMRVKGIYFHHCPFFFQSRGSCCEPMIRTGAGGFQ